MNKRGFSLIEFLIYIAIFSVIAGLMTGILAMVLKVNQKESASAETTSQLNFVTQTIGRLVRESSNIEMATSTATSTLKLRMKDSSGIVSTDRDPVVIWLDEPSKIIKMSEGTGVNKRTGDLTNNKVIADKLEFKKFSQYPGHDTVSIDIQLTYNSNNPNSRITRSLQSAIARVSAATFDSDIIPGGSYNFTLGQGGSPWQRIYMADGLPNSPSYTFANNGLGMFASSSSALGFSTAGIQRMTIAANGNVGIGTAGPGAGLEIAGAGGNPANRMRFKRTDSTISSGIIEVIGSDNVVDWSYGVNQLVGNVFEINEAGTTNRFVVLSGGNVGIGTTNPGAKLNVAGGNIRITRSDTSPQLILDNTVNGTLLGQINNINTGVNTGYMQFTDANGTPVMALSAGNVGIGTTNPGYTLTINGTAWVTSGAWSGSDIRWKKNIKPLENSLSKILSLQGVNFEWKKEEYSDLKFNNGNQIGFIAQDVEKIFPELVTTDNNGYKGISYEKFVPIFAEAIKEQQKQIEELKKDNENLKLKNKELEFRIKIIENR